MIPVSRNGMERSLSSNCIFKGFNNNNTYYLLFYFDIVLKTIFWNYLKVAYAARLYIYAMETYKPINNLSASKFLYHIYCIHDIHKSMLKIRNFNSILTKFPVYLSGFKYLLGKFCIYSL